MAHCGETGKVVLKYRDDLIVKIDDLILSYEDNIQRLWKTIDPLNVEQMSKVMSKISLIQKFIDQSKETMKTIEAAFRV